MNPSPIDTCEAIGASKTLDIFWIKHEDGAIARLVGEMIDMGVIGSEAERAVLAHHGASMCRDTARYVEIARVER